MARFKSKYAAAEFPVGSYAGGRVVQAAYGTIAAPAGVANNDVVEMCKVPHGALILRAAIFKNGAAIASARLGWATAPTSLTAIAAPVVVPRLEASPDVSGGGDVVIEYTVATDDAVTAGNSLYALVEYVYAQPVP